MAVNMEKARDFVYQNGTLFERAMFDYLFDGGSVERVQQILLCYKNPDNGFGHGFEHDLKAPQSNPLALEYLPIYVEIYTIADWNYFGWCVAMA